MNRINAMPAASSQAPSSPRTGAAGETRRDFAAMLGAAQSQPNSQPKSPPNSPHEKASGAASQPPHEASPRRADPAQRGAAHAPSSSSSAGGQSDVKAKADADNGTSATARQETVSSPRGSATARRTPASQSAAQGNGAETRSDVASGKTDAGKETSQTAADNDSDSEAAVPNPAADTDGPAAAAAPEAPSALNTSPTSSPVMAGLLFARLQADAALPPEGDAASAASLPTLAGRTRPAMASQADQASALLPSTLAAAPSVATAADSATLSDVKSAFANLALQADAAALPTAPTGLRMDLMAMPAAAQAPAQAVAVAPTADTSALPAALTQALVADASLPEALGERVLLLSEGGVSSARIELHPAELGSLVVRVEVQGDQAQVAFTADNPATRNMLQQALPQLRELLGTQGLQLLRSRVEERQRDTSGSAFAASRGRGETQQGARRISRIRLVDAYV